MAKILILDDDRDILRMMEFALKRAKHETTITTSGKQALNLIKDSPPDLIIVDIMMPEMTGYEFTRRVRTLPNLTKLPILIYSARFQPIDRQTALEAGATDYIPKNVSPLEIIEKIDELLGSTTPSSAMQTGQIIACLSLKGGVGVTSLSVNMATILAMGLKTPICLADFNPIAGHAGLMLKLRPQSSWQQVLALPTDALSAQQIEPHLIKHQSGIHLLASPLTTVSAQPNHQAIELLTLLQGMYRFTIIDLPHNLEANHLPLLTAAQKIVLFLTPDTPTLQSAVAAIKLLTQQGIPAENIAPVLNHTHISSSLSAAVIDKVLRQPLLETIPYDEAMHTAIQAGQPLVLHQPKSPTSAALARLVKALITEING